MPIDIGIFATDGNVYKQIDIIEIYFPKKYGLYGNIGEGVIYRYWKCKTHEYEFVPNFNEAITAINIKNEAESIGAISTIIFNSKEFSLFKKGNLICGETIEL